MTDNAQTTSAEAGAASPGGEHPSAGAKRRQTLAAHELRDIQDGKTIDDVDQDSQPADDMKQADAATLQKRQRLRIVRSGAAVPSPQGETTPASSVTRSLSPPEKPVEAPKPSAEESASRETKDEQNVGGGKAANGVPENGKEGASNSEKEQVGSSELLGPAEIKSVPTFSSAFASLSKQSQSSFFLSPPQSNAGSETSGTPSLFANLGSTSSLFSTSSFNKDNEDGTDAEDEQKAEEPSVIENEVDADEEILFTDRDCRMQRFDASQTAWAPKPPLEGRVQVSASKKPEDNGATRILFFVHRTGRLQLNTPLFASANYQHPPDRSRQRAVPPKDEKPDEEKNGEEPQAEEVPKKKNTAQFLGLRTDAQSSSDTTIYRIRFSNEEKCAEFLSLANERKTKGKSQSSSA
ncbi:UNVERIFIED_CONTAM: hypothetical protein HHA_258170 [Hammondia hammondi]|eukprot:XP_008883181.1 hypothetical protein HHA_258170 [Hammondia hammondi]